MAGVLSSMASFVKSVVKQESTDEYVSLGIDIGTTSIKTVVVHSSTQPTKRSSIPPPTPPPPPTFSHTVLSFTSSEHSADVPLPSHPTHSEQDPTKLLLSIVSAVRALPSEHRRRVEYVGVSCQMHGVVMWNDRLTSAYVGGLMAASSATPTFGQQPPHSTLVDWRDGRCSEAFLAQLNASVSRPSPSAPLQSGQWMSSGYGCATLAHLAAHSPAVLSAYTRAGSIGDYLVWLLMNVREEQATAARAISYPSYISPSNAAAWGAYEMDKHRWQTDRTTRWGIPGTLLPTVLTTAPTFPVSPQWVQWMGLGAYAHVGVAVGDAQASVWAVRPRRDQLVLYVGTSSQASLVVDEQEEDEEEGEDGEEEHGAGERDGEVGEREVSVSVAPSVNARAEGEERITSTVVVDFLPPAPPASAIPSTPSAHSSSSSQPPSSPALPSCEYRPYLDGRRLLVCASVNGGNAFEWLAKSVQLLHTQLSSPALLPPSSPPHSYRVASSSSSSSSSSPPHPLSHYYSLLLLHGYQHFPLPPSLSFHPTFLPDRWTPSTPPSLTFLPPSPTPSLSLGALSSSLALGLVRNLRLSLYRSLTRRERTRLSRVREVLGVGGALRRNGLLRMWAEKEWGVRLVMGEALACEWRRTEVERERERRRRASVGGGGGGGGGREEKEEAVEGEDESGYYPDAAFGAAILGLAGLVERRAKERIAASAMHL